VTVGATFRDLLELSMRRESEMLFKENGYRGHRGDLRNIIVLCMINEVAETNEAMHTKMICK
jgi:hypothetical protein